MNEVATSGPRVHTLANGVTLVCDPAPGFETLALSVVAGRGARWEDAARSGWSHLLEHMVFKGAGARDARQIVEAIEAQGGQLNAATGHERTSFQVRALAGDLPLALEIVGDLVQRPILDAEDLAREKRVVGQEIAEAADTPDDQVFELAQAAAFPDQPLGRPILGEPATVGSADPVSLGAWREGIYAPDRLVVSVAGAVDEARFLAEAERIFGSAMAPPAADPVRGLFVGGAVSERRRLEQAHLVFLLPAPGSLDDDVWALRVFVEILGGGMSSRLFQEARERLGLAYAIDAYCDTYADIGVLGVYAGCAAQDAPRLAEVTARQIRALAGGVQANELARAKAQLKASLFMSRESLLARAEQAAGHWLTFGRPPVVAETARAIDAVGAVDMARLGARLLARGTATVAALGPKPAMAAAAAFSDALFD
jgi:predicted Zn-dependent peptidase